MPISQSSKQPHVFLHPQSSLLLFVLSLAMVCNKMFSILCVLTLSLDFGLESLLRISLLLELLLRTLFQFFYDNLWYFYHVFVLLKVLFVESSLFFLKSYLFSFFKLYFFSNFVFFFYYQNVFSKTFNKSFPISV